jgi:hypothetical protein
MTEEEIAIISERLKKVEITNDIADIISSDPIESSKVIPYYRNLKYRTFSAFDKYPEEFETPQDFNLFLISKIPECTLTRVDWPEAGANSKLKFQKTGNIYEINKVISELIFLLRIKENIDYDNSSYKGFSSVTNWLFKKANDLKGDATSKVIHVVLQPRDHTFLTSALKVESDSLAYRLFLQTINLIIYLASLPSTDVLIQRIKDFLNNNVEGFLIKRNFTDTTNIEPYYVWMSVLSPEERGIVIKHVGENFFNTQNKLLRKYRSSKPGTSAIELMELKKKVDNLLSNGVKATVYGRLKIYHDIQRNNKEVIAILRERKGSKQLTDSELRRYAKKQGALSLFAEENIIASAYNVISKPIEIMDLTRNAILNPSTDRIFYYIGDIESSITYKSLLQKEVDKVISTEENALLLSIRSRAIQFVPGFSRRE